jgi:hypothetical protein
VFREAEMQISPVTMWLHPVCCYKRPLKVEEEFLPCWGFTLAFWTFCLAFEFCFEGLFAFEYLKEAFTLGFLVWEVFGREKNCWREKLLKGKELLKGNC